MSISKEQWTRIISIVLGAALAIAAVLGWALPITPLGTTVGGMQTLGADKVKSLNVSSNLTVGGDATVGGALTVVGTVYSATTAVLASVGDGTVSLPAYSFVSDPDSGVYVIGANNLGVGVAGAKVLDVGTTGLNVAGLVTATTTIGSVGAATVGSLTTAGDVSTRIVTATGAITSATTIGSVGAATVGSLTTAGDVSTRIVTATGAITAAGAITATGNLAANGVAFTGPIKYGTAATYVSGASITHGFVTTPTVCFMWPSEVTATVTITTTGFSCDTAGHATPVMWMCGK